MTGEEVKIEPKRVVRFFKKKKLVLLNQIHIWRALEDPVMFWYRNGGLVLVVLCIEDLHKS